MDKIPDESVDMILCDLPYGITRNKWDVIIPLERLWEQYHRICKVNSPIVLNCYEPFTTKLIQSNPKEFRYCWYWNKHIPTNFLNSHNQPLRVIDEIAVFYRKKPTYNPKIVKGKPQIKNKGHPTSSYGKCSYLPHVSEDYYPTNFIDIPQVRERGASNTEASCIV